MEIKSLEARLRARAAKKWQSECDQLAKMLYDRFSVVSDVNYILEPRQGDQIITVNGKSVNSCRVRTLLARLFELLKVRGCPQAEDIEIQQFIAKIDTMQENLQAVMEGLNDPTD